MRLHGKDMVASCLCTVRRRHEFDTIPDRSGTKKKFPKPYNILDMSASESTIELYQYFA